MSKNYVCYLRIAFKKDTPVEVIDIFKKDAVDFESCMPTLNYNKAFDRYNLCLRGDLEKYYDKIESLIISVREHIHTGYIGTVYPEDGPKEDLIYIYNNVDDVTYERVFE